MSELAQKVWHNHRGIFLILVLFILVGLIYNPTIPLFEAPAEGSHFRYVRHIAEGRGLPLIPADILFPQEHQAPLYYLFTGALISPLDLSGPTLPQPNPYHVYNNPGPIEDNRNSYYHTPAEAFPYQGLVLAVHIGRLVSLTMGAFTVLATYAIAYELFSSLPSSSLTERPYPIYLVMALGAAAINAFNPQFVFISNVMSNDTTASALSGWALFLSLLVVTRGISWQRSVLLGIAVGLAAISKLNGLAMLPIALLALAFAGLRRKDPISWLVHTLFVGSLVVLIAGWWYARNWVLYRDPLTLKLAAERWGSGGINRSFREIIGYWREIEVGFWGLFGHDNLLMDPLVYDVLHILELLAVVGLIVWGVRAWYYAQQNSRQAWPVTFGAGLGLVLLSFSAILLGLYRWLQVTDLPAGRYLYPAMTAISVLLFLGLSGLLPPRLTPILAVGMAIGLLALTLVAPFRYIAPAYTIPPILANDETIPNRVDISYAGRISLIGYEIQEDGVQPGDWLQATLYWQPREMLDTDLTVALRVLGRDGAVVGSKDTYPGLGRYPTSLWQPGLIIKDTYPIRVDFDAEAPARLSLDVSLYHQPTMYVLPKLDGAGNEIGQLTLGEAKLSPGSKEPVTIANETHYVFGDVTQLIGYSLDETGSSSPDSSAGDASQRLELTLYWRALVTPPVDYTVFIHLLDKDDHFLASWDGPPVGGDYPTHLWSAEEIIEDTHRLQLPPELAPGKYQLVVGLYQLDTLQRLSAFDAQGQRLPDDAVPLLTVPVREEKRANEDPDLRIEEK